MTSIAPHITAFFQQRLPLERRASEHTRDSYAYAFRLFLTYVGKRLHVAPSQLTAEQIDAPLVVDFLNDLEATRHNGPSSRNVRLAAIKSFMHFLEYRVPSALESIRRILAIPIKKTESRLVRHLTVDEMQTILDAPDPDTRVGIRDRAMLHVCYAAGLRVSELIGLRLGDVILQPQGSLLIHGKGRRERCLPLWKTTARALRAWLAVRGNVQVPELFVNARSDALTPFGCRIPSAQIRRERQAEMPFATDETCISARVETYVRPHGTAGHQRSAKGLAVARARAHAHHGNLHARRSVREAGSAGVDDASEIAHRPFQGHGRAHRIAPARTIMRSETP